LHGARARRAAARPPARAQEAVPEEQMKEELLESMQKGAFSMRILYEQFANIQKMGPVGQIMGMIPGLSNAGVKARAPSPPPPPGLPSAGPAAAASSRSRQAVQPRLHSSGLSGT